MPTIPNGMTPLVDSYAFKLPSSVLRVPTNAGAARYSSKYAKGQQLHSLKYRVSLDKLKEWNIFYHNNIQKGALPFTTPLDSGNGLSSHTVSMIPASYGVTFGDNYADIKMDVMVQSQILDLSSDDALTLISAWNTSAKEDFTGGFTFSSRFPYMAPNNSITRFDARYWIVDFRVGSVTTIVSSSATAFSIQACFRSNIDLTGIIWTSLDKYGHSLFRYDTDRDYTGTRLAFVANFAHPYDNSLTINVGTSSYIYRLFPYKNVSGTLSSDVADSINQGPGTGATFSTASIFPSGLTVPTGYQIYVIDFSNLKLGYSFDGATIPVTAIDKMAITLVPDGYGIGRNAVLANATAENLTQWHLTGVPADFRLQAGDVITVSYTQAAVFHQVDVVVTTWTGDGTTERYLTMATPMTGATFTGGKCFAKVFSLDSPLGNVDITLNVQNIAVTGSRTTVGKYSYPQPVNGLSVATGFDDSYSYTPYRQADQMYLLGYRGDIVCYMGASHYYKATSFLVSGIYYNRLDTTVGSSPLNLPTVAWCTSFFAELASRGLGFIWSTSLEILLSQIPPDWAQKDVDDGLSQSGYTPPTSFLEFNIPDVLTYLTNVIKQGSGLILAAGLALKIQLGEWWWWDGSYTGNKPCIYSYATKLLYNTQTGLFAPTTITNYSQSPLNSSEQAYAVWLGDKLGIATATVRDAIKAAYPTAQVCLLFFSPQIFTTSSVLLPIINFPVNYWKYPNYDFMQIEDYDWVIDKRFDLTPLTRQAALNILNYPIGLVQYFIGFVLTQDRQDVWESMHRALTEAQTAGITHNVVWAYSQVVRDGIVDNIRLPKGLIPTLNFGSYTIKNTDGVKRTSLDGSTPKNALLWKRGLEELDINMMMTSAELKIFLVFLYYQVSLGAVSFSCPVNDGQGIQLMTVNILPDSLNITAQGYNLWNAQMTIEGEPTYYV